MALDSNTFDDWLKDKPQRDLAFRGAIWIVLSCVTAYFAIKRGLTPIDYLTKTAESSTPLVNTIGLVALVAAAVAMCLKDLEALDPAKYGQASKIGRIGGFARRIGGDLMLWTLGAFIALLSVSVVAVGLSPVSKTEWPAVKEMLFLLSFLVGCTAALTYLVRRKGPTPTTLLLTQPLSLIIGYVVASLAVAANVWLRHGV